MNTKQKELKNKALERYQQEKEKLKRDLKDIKTVYVAYLNQQGTEMDFYFINIDTLEGPYLDRIFISTPYFFDDTYKDQYGLSPIVYLPFKDKPSYWEKSRNKNGGYCFRATGYGYSKSDACIKSLYQWLGYSNEDIYKFHKLPRVERLN